jgi:hypothetical protein
VIWGGTDNIFPDLWINMYDVDNGTLPYGPQNMTTDISVAGISTFGNVAPDAWTNPTEGTWTVHSVTQQLDPVTNDFYAPVQFTYMAAEYPLGNVSIPEHNVGSFFEISQNRPNPTTGESAFILNTSLSGDFKVEISNIMGQVLAEEEITNLSPGEHRIALPLENLSSGTYMYTVSAKGVTQSKRLVIE